MTIEKGRLEASAGKDVEKLEPSNTAVSSVATVETVWRFLKLLNIELPYDPVTHLISICPGELKTGVQTKTCTRMFLPSLFIITPNWKQPKCPLIDE